MSVYPEKSVIKVITSVIYLQKASLNPSNFAISQKGGDERMIYFLELIIEEY